MRRFPGVAFLLPCMAGFLFSSTAWAGTLMVDFDRADEQATQEGWKSFLGNSEYKKSTVPYPFPVTKSFPEDDLAGPGNSVDVSLNTSTSALYFRNYRAVTGSTINDVLRDEALLNQSGVLSLTLDNLLPDTYVITTYHHSNYSAQTASPEFDIRVTDALGTSTLFTDATVTLGTDVSTYSSYMFFFTVAPGGTSVLIEFDADIGASEHFVLNGFQLMRVPEPAAMTLLGLGAVMLLPLVRRRRK